MNLSIVATLGPTGAQYLSTKVYFVQDYKYLNFPAWVLIPPPNKFLNLIYQIPGI